MERNWVTNKQLSRQPSDTLLLQYMRQWSISTHSLPVNPRKQVPYY